MNLQLATVYREGLLRDTLPFWINYSVDRKCGGFLFALDRDGTVLSTDKFIWIHGRFIWLLSTLYRTIEPKAEWLDLAKHGLDFLRRYGFDQDGRMFFTVTREGKPLRKRRYLFSEAFAVSALAAYASAAHDAEAAQQAVDLFKLILRYHTTPGLLEPKVNPTVRPLKGLAMPMILTGTAQVLRENLASGFHLQDIKAEKAHTTLGETISVASLCQEWIDRSIAEIQRDFVKPEFQAVLETVGPQGEFTDNFEGRMVCPGHSIEMAWFVLHEAKIRGNDTRLRDLGLTILDWSWKLGWDAQFGGILYYRDAKGLPCTEYWHDMKFWWPHNEAIIATLLAYQMTGDEKYCLWHRQVHDWAYAHFPDPEFGEWYGYLHRDGTVSTRIKGNNWKGPFHLPRMQWYCWKLLE
jgi:N-acylglucosamine 2-epimerase